mgnify:CR=1 FL=1
MQASLGAVDWCRHQHTISLSTALRHCREHRGERLRPFAPTCQDDEGRRALPSQLNVVGHKGAVPSRHACRVAQATRAEHRRTAVCGRAAGRSGGCGGGAGKGIYRWGGSSSNSSSSSATAVVRPSCRSLSQLLCHKAQPPPTPPTPHPRGSTAAAPGDTWCPTRRRRPLPGSSARQAAPCSPPPRPTAPCAPQTDASCPASAREGGGWNVGGNTKGFVAVHAGAPCGPQTGASWHTCVQERVGCWCGEGLCHARAAADAPLDVAFPQRAAGRAASPRCLGLLAITNILHVCISPNRLQPQVTCLQYVALGAVLGFVRRLPRLDQLLQLGAAVAAV